MRSGHCGGVDRLFCTTPGEVFDLETLPPRRPRTVSDILKTVTNNRSIIDGKLDSKRVEAIKHCMLWCIL